MPLKPSTMLYLNAHYARERETAPVTIPAALVQPESRKPIKPLKRHLEGIEEVFAMYQQVRDANADWLADTVENKRKVSELFTSDDPRISHRLDLNDMKNAVTIMSPYLSRVPKPEPPKFPDDDLSQPLSDGTMLLPLDATPSEQRRASVVQMRNLVARLKRYEVWQREQQQEPQ